VVDWPLLLAGLMGIGPGLLVLLVSYSPYDGHFRDNVLFLFFMGGIFAGMAVAFFELLLLLPNDTLYRAGMVLVGVPIVEQLLKLVVLNRKNYRGDRATLFYGGSFGLGFATMVVLFTARNIRLDRYADPLVLFADPWRALAFLFVATSILMFHFAAGIIVGDGVRTQRLVPAVGKSIAAMVPLQFLVFEFSQIVAQGRDSEGAIYLPFMLAYALVLAWWAHTRVLPNALPPNAQRKRRRTIRRDQRTKAGP